jgi:hypothetical protein
MNNILVSPLSTLGYNFVAKEHIPKGKDEYYLRDLQNRSGISYRKLSAYEIEVLVRNRNTSDNWSNVLVSDAFNPELVKNCKFFGLVRIGKLEASCLSFHDIKLPVGLYNSTIISCDFGDNVVVDNVNYMSHYIVGNQVIIVNVNELAVTDHAKFGNGIIKAGEKESIRIWMEICNENGGRSVIPFNGMLPGDAWLWSRLRDHSGLMEKFKEFTQKKFDDKRGYYGKIGDRTIIKNSGIIKDTWIGSDAYIKGANKVKNITINSSADAKSQIGEGVELVNGIVGFGCRIFYGVKAVRFILASHSQLKYGARLINSYLGSNATISCCEVLNSLIFPAHEQHHNNSFLCAALVMGQSNIAAGATIGSNHNSRSADGEFIAARGFWPGLCVSMKHNSKIASFALVAKGDYANELNIQLPFALINNDVANDRLTVMPAYWFLYNMYALARNAVKHTDRDRRTEKIQQLEYDFLAPDSVNEMFDGLDLLRKFTGKAIALKEKKSFNEKEILLEGSSALEKNIGLVDTLEILAEGFENSRRKTVILKTAQGYAKYKEMIHYYGITQVLEFVQRHKIRGWDNFVEALPFRAKRNAWANVGGQLIPQAGVDTLLRQVHTGKVKSWDDVHAFYEKNGAIYSEQKFQHAFASLLELHGLTEKKWTKEIFKEFVSRAINTREWMAKAIYESRSKDYFNEYRKMVYENQEQMDQVLGKLDDNVFINQQVEELKAFRKLAGDVLRSFKV